MPRKDLFSLTGKIDSESFEVLYRVYWKKVYSVSLFYVKDEEQAKEFVQDVFKSLWERRDELVLHGNVEHYLVRAAKFKVLEHIRNKSNRQRLLMKVVPKEEPHEETTADSVAYNELRGRINHIVESLPTSCRQVYHFSREEGLSNKEIASRLGVSVRTVEYHLTNALRALRLHLSE